MKNLLKFFAVILVAALFLVSCDDESKNILTQGGTIEITNGTSSINYFVVIEGEDLANIQQALASILTDGELINTGAKTTKTYEKIGVYTVVAAYPVGFYKTAIVALGKTEKVTIE